jgi:hypothetical protein
MTVIEKGERSLASAWLQGQRKTEFGVNFPKHGSFFIFKKAPDFPANPHFLTRRPFSKHQLSLIFIGRF